MVGSVGAPVLKSGGPRLQSRSDHLLDLFHGRPRVQLLGRTCKLLSGLPSVS